MEFLKAAVVMEPDLAIAERPQWLSILGQVRHHVDGSVIGAVIVNR